MKPRRILFVHPGADFSIWDVGQGFRKALAKQGHEIHDYFVTRRMQYHALAMERGGKSPGKDQIAALTKQASETILIEALYHRADLIVVISGLNVNPIAFWLLDQIEPRIPVAIVLTESPYDDPPQAEFCAASPGAIVFTNERISAQRYGWHHLPPACDPDVHRPVDSDPAEACDVLMVGTGWPERQALLSEMDWSGIHLRLIGPWPFMQPDSPLKRFHEDKCVNNDQLPTLYASAKICLNFHRAHGEAESLNPRCYEVASCGAFQLSDRRASLGEIFDESVPTFRNASDLEGQIRYYLAHEQARRTLAIAARSRTSGQTFDDRAASMMALIDYELKTRAVAGAAAIA